MSEKVDTWAMSMLQAQSAMHDAIGNFSLVSDKEVATAAAYKALGLDPRDAPKFGWNMSSRPSNNTTTIVGSKPRSQIGPILSALAGAGIAAGVTAMLINGPTKPIVPVPVQVQSFNDNDLCKSLSNNPELLKEVREDLRNIGLKIQRRTSGSN